MASTALTQFPNLYPTSEVPSDASTPKPISIFKGFQIPRELVIEAWALLVKQYTEQEFILFSVDGTAICVDTSNFSVKPLSGPVGTNNGTAVSFSDGSGSTESTTSDLSLVLTYNEGSGDARLSASNRIPSAHLIEISRQLCIILETTTDAKGLQQKPPAGNEPKMSLLNPDPELLPGPQLLHQLLEQHRSDDISAIEYLTKDNEILQVSYSSFHQKASNLAARLNHLFDTQSLPPGKQINIPVLIGQSPELYIALLGILKSGAAFCPLQLDAPEERIKFVISDISASILVTTSSLKQYIPEIEGLSICVLDELDLNKVPEQSKSREPSPADLAYIMYTSGSTGQPKGVGLSHSAATQSILAHDSLIPPFTRFLQFASPTFDVSQFEIFFTFFRGCTLLCCEKNQLLNDLPNVMKKLNCDAAELTPTVAGSLLRTRDAVPDLKILLTIGEMLNPRVVEEFGGSEDRLSLLYGMYGPTEATIHCTLEPQFDAKAKNGMIGQPFKTVSSYIVESEEKTPASSDLIVLPVGQIGELAIGGSQLAVGYLNRKEQTDAAFINSEKYGRVYRTGDKARQLPCGSIECLGRIQAGQVKLRGQRIELGEIEQVALKAEACQLSVASIINGNLVLFCLADAGKLQKTEIRKLCQTWLPAFMIPGDIVLVQEIPRLPSGKVDKKTMEASYSESMDNDDEDIGGDIDELGITVLEITKGLLGPHVRRSSSLSRNGLDSLSSIRLASALRSQGYSVGAIDILNADSVRQLCASLREYQDVNEAKKSYEDSFAQIRKQAFSTVLLKNHESEIEDLIPCTPLQAAMLAETAINSSAYCNSVEIEFGEKADAKAIDWALNQVFAANAALRSGFIAQASSEYPYAQVIWKSVKPNQLLWYDNVTPQDFNISDSEALLRPVQVHISKGGSKIRCLFKIHHSLYDGWSMDLIVEDLAKILKGVNVEARPHFRKVVDYYAGLKDSETQNQSKQFWKHYLEDFKPTPFPSFCGSDAIMSQLKTSQHSVHLTPDTIRSRLGQTFHPQGLFQSALAYLMTAYLGTDDVVFGSVNSGRTIPVTGIEDIVGPCIATLPFRVSGAARDTVASLLLDVNDTNRKHAEHCTLPLQDIKGLGGVKPGQALFDVLFIWQETLNSQRLDTETCWIVDSTDYLEFKLVFEVEPRPDHLAITARYHESLIPTSQIHHILKQLEAVMKLFLESQDLRVDDVLARLPKQCLSLTNLSQANGVKSKQTSPKKRSRSIDADTLIKTDNHHGIYSIRSDNLSPIIITRGGHPDLALRGGVGELAFRFDRSVEVTSKTTSEISRAFEHPELGHLNRSGCVSRLLPDNTIEVLGSVNNHFQSNERPEKDNTSPSHGCIEGNLNNSSQLAALERSIAVAVSQITKTPIFDIHRRTSFFALGVDSISAVALAQAVHSHTNSKANVSQILKFSCVAELAVEISNWPLTGEQTVETPNKFDEENLDMIKHSARKLIASTNIGTIRPCTALQEAMLSAEMSSQNKAYFNHTIFEINGHIARFQYAINEMFSRHDILRTCFIATQDQSFAFAQVVLKDYLPRWETVETQHDNLTLELNQRKAISLPAVDQSTPPLRLASFVTPEKIYVMLSMHHALYDAQAMDVLFSEIEAVYRGQSLQQPVSFDHFLNISLSQTLDTSDKYWAQMLRNFVPVGLPPLDITNLITNEDSTTSVNVQSLDLPMSLRKLEDSSKRASVNLLNVVQAAWARTLMTLLGDDDVCFGNVVSGRAISMPGVERLVAPCFNTLPVRVKVSQATTNDDLISELQSINSASLEHQFTPLRRIQRLQNDTGEALFDTIFILQRPTKILDHNIWELQQDFGDMGFPLVCEVIPNPTKDTIEMNLHFRKSRISNNAIDVVMKEFCATVESCIESPSAKVLHPETDTVVELIKSSMNVESKTLPVGSNSLLSRGALKAENDNSRHEKSADSTDVSTTYEQEIRNAFATFSKVPKYQISRNKTIYQLGLDSISAIQIAKVLRDKGFNTSAEHVLGNPSVASLAQAIRASKEDQNKPQEVTYFQDFDRQFREHICELASVPSESVDSVLPCTALQAGMIARFLHSSSQNYFNNFIYELGSETDLNKLCDAWKVAVGTHKMLRTGFVTLGSQDCPFAMICYKQDAVTLPWYDIQASGASLDDLKAGRSKLARKAFESFQDPPWFLSSVSSGGKSWLQFSGNHALFDAESLQFIIKDVHAIYANSERLEARPIEPLLRAVIDGGKDEDGSHEAFWLEHLRDATVTKFPNMLPLQQDGRTLQTESLLANASMHELEHGCQERGVSLQAVIQVVWATLLSAYTGEADVCFGLVLAGRESEQAQTTVFPCGSTVPFRCTIDGDIASLLERTMCFNSSVRKHRHSPLNQIQRWLGLGNSALFDTLLVFQKTLGDSLDEKFLRIVDEDASVEYPVSVELIPRDSGRLEIQTTFWDDVLPKAQAGYMLQEFDVLLSGILGDFKSNGINGAVQEPNICSALKAKDPEIPADVNLLHQYVEVGAQKHPNKVAFEYYTEITPTATPQQWTYETLNEMGNKYACAILKQVAPRSIVVTCFDKCPEASFSFLGILKAGCAFLAVDPNAPMVRKTFIVEDSKAAAILTTPEHIEQFEEHGKIPIIDAKQVRHKHPTPQEFVSPKIDPEDTSYCLYTSGSTGTPKGCILSHHNAVQFISYFQRLFKGRWTEKSRWLQFASFHFDVMVLEQFWPWSVGISCVSAARDALFEDLAGALSMLNITHIDLTPSLARLITPEDVPSLCDGIFITGGEPLKQEVLDAWGHTGAIHNGYGPTECTIGCTMFAQVPEHGKASNIGVQYDNAGSYVLKPGTNEIVMRGALGELCISGVLVGKGYLGRPDLTKEKFPFVEAFGERIYRTGDLVRLQCDNTFEFVGRIDDQVKLRGQRLELGEINAAITNSSAPVDDVATLVVKVGQKQTEQLCSFVVLKNPRGVKSSELLGQQDSKTLESVHNNCRDKLPPYMVPTQFILINYLPLTTNNKVDAGTLKALLVKKSTSDFEGRDSSQSATHEVKEVGSKPSGENRRVAITLSRYLRLPVDQLSDSTNFFQAGLDSISVFGFVQELRKDGFAKATSQVVMGSKTIDALAQSLVQVKDAQDGSVTQAKQFIAACKHRYRPLAAESLKLDLRDIEVAIPLTPLQQGIVARSLESDEGLYYNKFVFELAKNIDTKELRSAWQSVVDEVSVLRTCFVPSNDGYIQAVLQRIEVSWTEHKLKSRDELKSESQKWHREWCRANESLIERPFEIHLARVGNQTYMILHLFHGLYDAMSLPLILGRVQSKYQGVEKIECGPSFYEVLAYGPLKQSKGAKDFWTEKLRNAQFNLMRTGEPAVDKTALTVSRTLNNLTRLEEVRRQLNVTHQAFVQVAWMATLQNHIEAPTTTGLLVSGRSIDCDDVERTIGPLFNTLPFTLQFDQLKTWESAIRNCHDFNIAALPYQHTPLRDITKWIGKSSREPLFDSLLVFQKNPGIDSSRSNSLWKEVDHTVAADYPLAFEVEQTSEDQLNLTLVTEKVVMSQKQCNRFLDKFYEILIAMVEQPNQRVSDVMGEAFEAAMSKEAPEERTKPAKNVNGRRKLEESDFERRLRDTIASIADVDLDDVQINTSIFELGLDSVDAIKVSSKLKREGLALSVSSIVRGPTVSQMAQNVRTTNHSDSTTRRDKNFEDIRLALEASVKSAGYDDSSVETILPATPLQEAIVAEMEKSEMKNYMNHDVLKVSEHTDIEQLKQAWNIVIAQSPILRTSFVEIDDVDLGFSYGQLVRRYHSQSFPVIIKPQSRTFQDLFKDIQGDLAISTSSAAPLRLTLVRDTSTTYLILSISHALYDGWSLGLLHRDVQQAYKGLYKPRPSYLETLKDIVAGTDYRAESFWRNAVSGAQGCMFPLRQLPPNMDGSKVHFMEKTSAISATKVQTFCRAENVTMQALGQSCWAFTLATYLRSFDVSFGVVLLGRDGQDADKILFPTMNTVVIRLLLHGSRREMLRYVQSNLADVTEHQHYPLRKVQQMSALKKDAKLFDTLFIYQRRPTLSDDEEPIYSSVGGASDLEYPVSVEMEMIDDTLVWRTSTKEQALSEDETAELLGRLDRTLQFVMDAPDEPSVEFEGQSASICGHLPFDLPKDTSSSLRSVSMRERKESFDAIVSSETDEKLKRVLSALSKVPVSEINDSDTIYNLGLDSISAIKLASLLKREGIKLTVSQILQARTVKRIGWTIEKAKQQTVDESSGIDTDEVLEIVMKDVNKSEVLNKSSLEEKNVERIVPATAAQTLFLTFWCNSQGGMFYPTFDFRITGLKDAKILFDAWKTLVQEIPLLRTVFVATENDSVPVCQVVLKEVDNNCSSTESPEVYNKHRQDVNSYAHLHAIKENSLHYFQIRIHHALYDAVSLPFLQHRLQDICNDIQFSKPHRTIPSSNFYNFMAQINASQARDDRHSFWSYYLSQSEGNSIHKPSSAGLKDSFDRTGAYRPHAMESISHLDMVTRKHGVSLQSLLFATVAIIYARQNNVGEHEDVVFGAYLANRGDGFEALVEPTLNIVPLRVRSPLNLDPVNIAKQIQEDLHAIGRRGRPFVSLWEIDRWTGVKIDCFLNFLRLPDQEDNAVDHNDSTEEVTIEMLDSLHMEGGPEASEKRQDCITTPAGLVSNTVSSSYIPCIDVEAAVRDGGLAMGVFGPATILDMAGANEMIDYVCSTLDELE